MPKASCGRWLLKTSVINANSSAAFAANAPRRQTQSQKIADRVAEIPSTREEIADDLHMRIQTVSGLVPALIRSGQIEEHGTRKTASGCSAAVLHPGPNNAKSSQISEECTATADEEATMSKK